MQQTQHAIEQGTGAAVSSLSAAGALVMAQDWALALFGVPLFVVLAGFAGVFYGLTLREPMTPARLWTTIVLTTFLATAGGGWAAAYWSLPPTALAGLSAIAGFLLVVGQPWLKKNLPDFLNAARDRVLALLGRQPPKDGGQP